MKGEDGKEKTFVGPALTEVVGAPLLVGESLRIFPVSLLSMQPATPIFFQSRMGSTSNGGLFDRDMLYEKVVCGITSRIMQLNIRLRDKCPCP